MTRRAVMLAVLAVAGVVGLVAGLGYDERARQEGEPGLLERALVGAEEPEPTTSLQFACDGSRLSFIDDAGQGYAMGDVTKTGVLDGSAHISGTLGMMNIDDFAFISLATKHVSLAIGGVNCQIRDISTEASWQTSYDWTYIGGYTPPVEGHSYVLVAFMYTAGRLEPMGPLNSILGYQYYYFDEEGNEGEFPPTATPYDIELDFDYSITGKRRTCQESVTPTGERDTGPAYANEVHYADDLTDLDTVSWTITFGPWTFSDSYVVAEFAEDPPVVPVSGWTYGQEQHHWNADVHYGKFRVAWDGVDLDLARFHKEYTDWRWEGVAGGIDVYGDGTGGTGTLTHSVSAGKSLGADFSDFEFTDMDGNRAGDTLVLSGNVQASNHLPASLQWSTTPDGLTTGSASPGDTVYPTVAQLRAVGEYVDPPTITGLDYRDPADSYRFFTSATHQWAITEEGVQATVATVGHEDDDLTVELRVTGVDATDIRASPDYAAVNFAHKSSASVYGPGPALAHDDWVGTGGVSTPNASGDFAVSGDGTLYLDIPCNLGRFLDEVPDENFPDGMQGLPDIGRWHRADFYRAYDGELDQNGQPFSVPLEGRYCGRGWPCLELNFPTAAANDTLTIVLSVITHTYTDGHWTSSKRQTGTEENPYSHTETPHTYTYQATISGGKAYVYLAVPAEITDPDLEQVERITISGFSNGSWRVGAPHWALDPYEGIDGGLIRLKVFEGRDYKSGGLTATVQSVAQYALCDSVEDNGGHENLVEWPVLRMWDYRISDPDNEVQLDFTGAYDLAGFIAAVEDVCDAWEASLDTTVWDTATLDEEDNRLCGGYAFNFCGPLDGHRLAQDVDGTKLNAALRCGSWTAVAGFIYPIRPDKVIDGALHGAMRSGNNLARSSSGQKVWRKPADEATWTEFDAPTSDLAGFYATDSGEVQHAYSADVLFDYGVGNGAGSVTSTGRFAAREWAAAVAEGAVVGAPWLHYMRGGMLHLVYTDASGVVRYGWVEPFSSAPEMLDTGAHPFAGEDSFANPFITSYACGWLLVGATKDGGMRLARSVDFGATWTEISGTTLVSDLQNGCIAIQDGILAACGWLDEEIVCRSSSGDSYAAEALYVGGATEATICSAALLADGSVPRSQVLWFNGELNALVETDSGTDLYRSRDWGRTWTKLDAPHVGDDLRAGNAAFASGEVVLCGHDGEAVQVETAFNDARTAEGFYGGGPTQLQVVAEAAPSAIEAVYGERWAAVGAVTLYRLRNPADGFEEIA